MGGISVGRGALLLNGVREQGVVLIFCLVFLLILTMMGVASMDSAMFEERMAGNMQDYNEALQAAESALRTAEDWLLAQATRPAISVDGSTRVRALDALDPSADDSLHWWQDNARNTSAWWHQNAITAPANEGFATLPHYIIEEMSTSTSGQSLGIGSGLQARTSVFYRVTARGSAQEGAAVVQLQSIFVKGYE